MEWIKSHLIELFIALAGFITAMFGALVRWINKLIQKRDEIQDSEIHKLEKRVDRVEVSIVNMDKKLTESIVKNNANQEIIIYKMSVFSEKMDQHSKILSEFQENIDKFYQLNKDLNRPT